MEKSRLTTSLGIFGVGVLFFFLFFSPLSSVTGFLALLNTEPLTEEMGCLPCNNPVEVVDAFGTAEFPNTSPDSPRKFRVSGRWH